MTYKSLKTGGSSILVVYQHECIKCGKTALKIPFSILRNLSQKTSISEKNAYKSILRIIKFMNMTEY